MTRPASLQTRLLLVLLAVLSGVWILAAVLSWNDTRHELDELLDAHLTQSAALLVAQQTRLADDDDDDDGKKHVNEHERHKPTRRVVDDDLDQTPALHKYATRVAFQVFHDGTLALHSGNAPNVPLSGQRRGFDTVTLADGSTWRVFGAQGAEGDVQVFVGEQMQSRKAIVWAMLQGVLTPLLLALPVLAALGWLAVRRGLAPLRALSQGLAQRQPHALEALLLPNAPSEIVPVVQSLNALFERIGQMMAFERRFTADAAHELRTPVAAIRAQAQVALGAGSDDAQRQQALRQTLEGCDRATHLVAQLLTLSRLETPGEKALAGEINLSAIAQRIAADLAPSALARTQQLTLQAPQACTITADDSLTGVLIRNLLDNALRYSPNGAQVSVTVHCLQSQVLLQVDDSGPGVSAADLARLGERFFRVLGTDQSGSGLGWSIVRRIARLHNLRLQVDRSPALGGLRVQVSW